MPRFQKYHPLLVIIATIAGLGAFSLYYRIWIVNGIAKIYNINTSLIYFLCTCVVIGIISFVLFDYLKHWTRWLVIFLAFYFMVIFGTYLYDIFCDQKNCKIKTFNN